MPSRSKRKRAISSSESSNEENEEGVFEVEELVAHRKNKRKSMTEYYVKWKGYDPSENTWELEEDILSKDLIKSYWEKHSQSTQPSSSSSSKKTPRKRRRAAPEEEETTTAAPEEATTASETEQEVTTASSAEQEVTTASTQEREVPTGSSQGGEVTAKSRVPKKEYHKMKQVPVNALPPKGMRWSELIEVAHIFVDKNSPNSPLLAQLKWPDNTTSYCLTKTLRKKAPEKLIDYYEYHLVARPLSRHK